MTDEADMDIDRQAKQIEKVSKSYNIDVLALAGVKKEIPKKKTNETKR